ncbi:MAG: fibrillarin-like rRNA/tRNA 2'-O-methyltransferase [Candidatus Aenigmarchaeota archaeon]|nr:fibrillarin-like rRNA/tRNA 2'-O-methyltransferase [Candidatus Aenigmarchaeota archaeon]
MDITEKFPGVFLINGRLHTLNHIPSFAPFGEQLFKRKSKEFRPWDPNRSKAAAAIMKGIKYFPIEKGSKILYLGAAHGYTPSHLSNIIGPEGVMYAIEFSDRPFQELLPLSEKLKNIVPILADARKPELYDWIEEVDIVYVDIADPQQTEVAIRNCNKFLKDCGYLMLTVKTQSIDITKQPKEVVREEMEKVTDGLLSIIDWNMLDPFEAKHGFIVAKK